MKKISILFISLMLIFGFVNLNAQVLSESAKRKVTVGFDLFTDIWQYQDDGQFIPEGFRIRTINQGTNVFAMYNFALGESLNSFSIGLAFRWHNLFSNSVVADIKGDTIRFERIPDELSFRKVKINPVYVDIPIELKIRTQKGFKLGIGLKGGYLIDSKEKYKGDRPEDNQEVKTKTKGIFQLERFAFGGTLRIGYRWISVFGYYQFTKMFRDGRGPDIYPISVGITVTPF